MEADLNQADFSNLYAFPRVILGTVLRRAEALHLPVLYEGVSTEHANGLAASVRPSPLRTCSTTRQWT